MFLVGVLVRLYAAWLHGCIVGGGVMRSDALVTDQQLLYWDFYRTCHLA